MHAILNNRLIMIYLIRFWARYATVEIISKSTYSDICPCSLQFSLFYWNENETALSVYNNKYLACNCLCKRLRININYKRSIYRVCKLSKHLEETLHNTRQITATFKFLCLRRNFELPEAKDVWSIPVFISITSTVRWCIYLSKYLINSHEDKIVIMIELLEVDKYSEAFTRPTFVFRIDRYSIYTCWISEDGFTVK